LAVGAGHASPAPLHLVLPFWHPGGAGGHESPRVGAAECPGAHVARHARPPAHAVQLPQARRSRVDVRAPEVDAHRPRACQHRGRSASPPLDRDSCVAAG
jgi:hypothetical protein